MSMGWGEFAHLAYRIPGFSRSRKKGAGRRPEGLQWFAGIGDRRTEEVVITGQQSSRIAELCLF